MTLFTDIQAELHVQLTPAVGLRLDADLGYGRDLFCVRSVTDDLREVDPQSPEGIGQTVFRLLLSVRETIPDAPGRGLGVQGWVSAGVTFTQLRAYGGMCIGEIDQDDRIASSTVDVKLEGSREVPALRFEIRITPQNPALAPFAMVITVPESGAALLEILRR